MISITLDTELSRLMNSPHPFMVSLKALEKDKKISIFTTENQMMKLKRVDKDLYDKIRFICFPEKNDVDLTTNEHSNLCLLTDHADKKRNFFITSNLGAFVRAFKEDELNKIGINIRLPDQKFLEELEDLTGGDN